MVFEINVFQRLSRGTFNGFSHGMCVSALRRWCVRVGPKPGGLPPGGGQRANRASSRLTSPRLALSPRSALMPQRDPEDSLSREKGKEKKRKMEKGRRHIPKSISLLLIRARARAKTFDERTLRCARRRLSPRFIKSENGQTNLCISRPLSHTFPCALDEEFDYTVSPGERAIQE